MINSNDSGYIISIYYLKRIFHLTIRPLDSAAISRCRRKNIYVCVTSCLSLALYEDFIFKILQKTPNVYYRLKCYLNYVYQLSFSNIVLTHKN